MKDKIKVLKIAFPYTIPIFAGFMFLGLAYGIYMNSQGFSFIYPMIMSFTIFAGSMEFVTVNLLVSAFNPIYALVLAIVVNARHLFYGISMLERFKGTGRKKLYLIYGMCDESFSINFMAKIPEGVDKGWFMFFVTMLNQLYWVIGSTLGGILGSYITFNTKGIDFVMTALFVVIFLEQWLSQKQYIPSIIGVIASVICLIGFGADNFIIPSMLVILVVVSLCRKRLEGKSV